MHQSHAPAMRRMTEMGGLIPRTALPGQSRSSHDRLARGLGYFSIGLGLLEVLAPRVLCRAAGLKPNEDRLVQAYGAREIATGIAILTSHDATPWIWGRLAGDALDVATVVSDPGDNATPTRKIWTTAALLGVGAVDIACAIALTREKGGPRTAHADYRDRSGFPKGVEAARGSARNLAGRNPEPLARIASTTES
jgi:hypothetical protein